MGSQDALSQGYPKSLQKKDWLYFRYCGGKGGGGCFYVQTLTQVRFAIEVNPFLVRNRSLTLNNPAGVIEFYGKGTDLGSGCFTSSGSPLNWYLAFSTDGVLTNAECVAQNNLQTGAAGYDIEIPESKLPQPSDAGWDGKIYVHICWIVAGIVSDAVLANDQQYLRVVQHNYDVRH